MFKKKIFFFKVLVEDVTPANPSEVIYKSNVLFNKFDEQNLYKDLKNFNKKRASKIVLEMKKQPDQLSFNENGTVIVDGLNIPESNIKSCLEALFSGKGSPAGFKEFVVKLQEMGLTRYIPKKFLPKKDFDPQEIVEQNPFSLEKWYYIGQ